MSRYLITGGCGFLGSYLVDSLLAEGHTVRVLDNLSTGRIENVDPAARISVGCATDADLVAELVERVDGCFHLVGAQRGVRGSPGTARRTPAGEDDPAAFRAVVDAICGLSRPIPLVYASSAAVYGDSPVQPLSEDIPPAPVTVGGSHKLACETYAALAQRRHGLRSVGFRMFSVYGPLAHPRGVVSTFAAALTDRREISIFGDGEQLRDFIHVTDVVAYLVAAMRRCFGGANVFNLCTGIGTPIGKLAGLMAEIVGDQPDIRYLPARRKDFRAVVGSPDKTIGHFGFTPTVPLAKGLESILATIKLLDWF